MADPDFARHYERIAEQIASLDLEKKFREAGAEWAEADEEGSLVMRTSDEDGQPEDR